uniref:Ion transport domain-containing protein n=1 Tax=Tetradesmus obliquus TaxID=3088 RepID=A0A383WLY0_TETOB|eukprot:jgi/Sobl393_1/10389/SZX77746.1
MWSLVRGAEVKVRWQGFSLKQRAWLNITNQRREYEEQPLLLYALASNSGALPAGAQLQLPALSTEGGECLQETPCKLGFPPVVVLCSARGDAGKPRAAVIGATAARWNSNAGAADLSGCTLDELCSAVEEGDLDASSISQATADMLLHRAMAAGDDELLLMLVQADVCLRCSQPSLQLLLAYACQRNLLPLAETVLHCTTVEMTCVELTWLVGKLVATKNMYDVERLLASYILMRRNALSSTAAVEHALMKAATASFVSNQDALQLAKRFRAAKHALLRQLMKRYSDEQKGCAASTAAEDSGSLHAPGSDGLQLQTAHLPGSGRYQKHGNTPLALLNPLLHTVKLCLQETSYHVIGRGGGVGRFSIHDSSPYSLAMALGDSEFLGLQPVREYTRLIWRGLELHRMRRVLWQAVASAEEAAAADGPFRNNQLGTHHADAAAHDSRFCTAELVTAGAPAAGHADEQNTPDPKVGFGDSTPVRLLLSCDGEHAARAASSSFYVGAGPCAEGVESSSNSSGSLAAAVGSSWMDPNVGFNVLHNLGLAGGLGSQLVLVGAFLLHGVLVPPRALHDSSWGRWVKRMVFEVLLLVIYQLDVLVNFGLLGLLVWEYVCWLTGVPPIDVFGLRQYGISVENLVQAAFAVLVWSRALGLLTPLGSKLGAMLYILRRAAEEVAVLVPVVLVLILGFGTTLTATYHTTEPKFNALAGAMRMLGNPNDLRLSEIDDAGDGNPFLVVWGQAVTIVYIAVVSILIMSLLVAVFTNTYNPESVTAHAVVMQAESTFHYDFHVRHALPCSPVNLLHLLLAWLPRGFRSRVLPASCLKWWVIPLDGYVPQPIAGSPAMLLATGPSEVGYLAFMFLMYPLFAATGLVLLAAYVPFGVLHFALKGHTVWLEASWSEGSSTDLEGLPAAACATLAAAAAASAAAAARAQHRTSIGDLPGGQQQRRAPSFDLDPRQFSLTSAGRPSGLKPIAVPGGAFSAGPASPATQQRLHQSHAAPLQRSKPWLVTRLLQRAATMLAAAVVGMVAYVLLLVAVVLTLLYAWTTRTVFSLYCIFSPNAADSNCCMKLTRAADFWRAADVQAAFSAAKLAVGGPHMQQDQADDTHIPRQSGEVSCSVALPQAQQYIGKAALPRGPLRAAAAYSHIGSTAPAACFEGDDSSHVSSPWYSEAGGVIQAVPGALAAKAAALRAASGFDGRDIDDENVGSLEREVRQQLIGRVCWASTSGDGSSTTRL